MSQAVKAAMLATKGLGKNERAVAIAIAAHTNRAGDAWPSVATIAEYADCSERTAQRAIAKLISLGRLAWRHVAGIATRVYRLVVDAVQGVTPGTAGVTNDSAGATDQAAGGDSQGDTRSGEEDPKMKRAGARDWRRWIPKSKNPAAGRPPYPERRGAALPPPPGGDRCQKRGHEGQIAGRCIPCRSEALAGAR